MDHADPILTLGRLRRDEARQVGAKAYTLSRLKRRGFAVPDGFCVAYDAYDQHVDQNGLKRLIEEVTQEPLRGDAEAIDERLLCLRERICEAPLSQRLNEALGRAFEKLDAQSVAVRSSATAEDLPGHSFAGQYDTILNVTSAEECVTALKQCWASLWTARAFSYRAAHGIDHAAVKMAVMVQRQIDAEVAGVLFTADPISGSPSRVVIESCEGMGEKLVSGRVTPERMVFRKRGLRLIRRSAAGESDVLLALPLAKRLARRGCRIEKLLAGPQDIEWAVEGNKISFLQARPVTMHVKTKTWEQRQVWSNLNTAEVLPDVVTPMTWSILQQLLDSAFRPVFRLAGADIKDSPVIGLVAGRGYFNLNTLLSAAMPFLPIFPRALEIDTLLGGQQNRMAAGGHLDIPDEDLADLGFSWPRYVAWVPRNILEWFMHRPSRGTRFLETITAVGDDLNRLALDARSNDELASTLLSSLYDNIQSWDLLYLVVGTSTLPLLDRVCRTWLGEADGTLGQRLFVAQGGMCDTQAGLDLWRLALCAHEDGQTEAILTTGGRWSKIRETLSDSEHGRRFLGVWECFMQTHGHHCRGELELANARWSETPDYLLDLIRTYLASIEGFDPIEQQQRLAEERQRLVTDCHRRLGNPVKRRIFAWALKRAQQGVCDRENWKNQAVRQIAAWRRILLELGDRLCRADRLDRPGDIFFLGIDELEKVVSDGLDSAYRETIAQRLVEYRKHQAYDPPHIVVGRFDPERQTLPRFDPEATIFQGIAASPGVVSGKARIILRADDQSFVRPGEILVAPFTDPAWTPYFVPAAGIVMDQGGLLSHGSIIAREYGIPAVVNVGPATRVIKTGQTLHLDANRGLVRIGEDELPS